MRPDSAMTQQNDRIVFLGSPICPYCQRVEVALHHANCEYEEELVALGSPTATQLRKAPFGRFPVLAVGEEKLFESGAILEWLNERSGGTYLPKGANERAQVRGLCLAIDAQHAALRIFFTAPTLADVELCHAKVVDQLQRLERMEGPWAMPESKGFAPLLSAFYLAPLVLLCDVLDSKDFPLLGSIPGLLHTHRRLALQHPAFRRLGERRAKIAGFLRGVPGALTSLIGSQLEHLSEATSDAESLARGAQRYMQRQPPPLLSKPRTSS